MARTLGAFIGWRVSIKVKIKVSHYLALVEDAGPETAVGVRFLDLPGCFSAGDTFEEALINAREAIALYAEEVALPPPRSLAELKADPALAAEIATHIVAAIPYEPLRPAAE
jgi:predicted RNase H-like HicB family nuclease